MATINVIIGDTKQLVFTVVDGDGVAVDLSASTVKFMVKKSKVDDDDDAVLVKEFVNPSTNIVICELSATDTLLFKEETYYCALKVFYDSGVRSTAYSSELRATKGVFDE